MNCGMLSEMQIFIMQATQFNFVALHAWMHPFQPLPYMYVCVTVCMYIRLYIYTHVCMLHPPPAH